MKHVAVLGQTGFVTAHRDCPPPEHWFAGEFVDHQAVGIDEAAQASTKNAGPRTGRLPFVDAQGLARIGVNEPTEGERPVETLDRAAQARQVLRGPPVVVVKVGDIATVGSVAHDGAQGPTVRGGVQATVASRGRVAEIENAYRAMARDLSASIVDNGGIVFLKVDAEQDLDSAWKILGEYGLKSPNQARAQDRRHDDGDVERGLQICVTVGNPADDGSGDHDLQKPFPPEGIR